MPTEDRNTYKVSSKVLDEVKERLQGLKNGVVAIFVKNGYILAIERRERTHFTSKINGVDT